MRGSDHGSYPQADRVIHREAHHGGASVDNLWISGSFLDGGRGGVQSTA